MYLPQQISPQKYQPNPLLQVGRYFGTVVTRPLSLQQSRHARSLRLRCSPTAHRSGSERKSSVRASAEHARLDLYFSRRCQNLHRIVARCGRFPVLRVAFTASGCNREHCGCFSDTSCIRFSDSPLVTNAKSTSCCTEEVHVRAPLGSC